ncbi:MAG TPA: hypothetical protein VF519_12390 [Mycobacteriales bacterium]|jgi:hypothetical protein
MRRALPVLLALLSVPFAAPAEAVPPALVSGSGTILPGLVVPCCVYPVWITFTGTAQGVTGTHGCSFQGQGVNLPTGGATGTVASASCGSFALTGCAFELTPQSLTLGCTGTAGYLVVQYTNLNPTTIFTVPYGVLL